MAMLNLLDTGLYLQELKQELDKPASKTALLQRVVDAPFQNPAMTASLGLGITVLLLVNKKEKTIDRIALARTDLAQGTLDMSAKPFSEIKIPLTNKKNYIASAIRRGHHMVTSDWQYLFVPVLTPEESRFNQAGGGIACSVIYPLVRVGDGGAMIFSYYEQPQRIGKHHHEFMSNYARMVGLRLKEVI